MFLSSYSRRLAIERAMMCLATNDDYEATLPAVVFLLIARATGYNVLDVVLLEKILCWKCRQGAKKLKFLKCSRLKVV